MLAEHYFKHKINHYVILPSFQKQKIKYSSFTTWNPTFSRARLRDNGKLCYNVLFMRSEDCKEISRFQLPSWGRVRLLLN